MTGPTVEMLPALIGGLAATGLGALASWSRRAPGWLPQLVDGMGGACLLAALAVWAMRFRAADHLPLFGTFESALSLAVAVLAVAALLRLRGAPGGAVWTAGCGVTALLLLHGLAYDPTVYALTISERSWVVDLHAFAAWLAFGVLTGNAGLALFRVGIDRFRKGTAGATRSDDRLLSTTLSLGFLLHTAMLVSGSVYKFLLFGTAWSFDPIETLGFVAWLAYGTLLHLHLMADWSGRRLAAWCLGVFAVLVISYRGIVYFPSWSTYHIFDMDLRTHLTGGEGETP